MEPQSSETTPPATPVPPSKRPLLKDRLSTISGTIIIYAVVLLIALLGVYLWQNGRIQNVKDQLAASQRKVKQLSAYDQGIDKQRFQAVFLSSGQVYFGKVESVNEKYLTISHIFYLQKGGGDIQSGTTSSATSLVKLGCELHAPYDKMTINRERIDFWENLKDSGQVGEAIKDFIKDNPEGQRCS